MLAHHLTNTERFRKIAKWNEERDNKTFSIFLEKKMLSEEFAEFYQKKELKDKLDAIADFIFVYEGSLYKINESNPSKEEKMNLITWAFKLYREMFNDLQDYLKELKIDKIEKYIFETLDIVIEANNQKGKTKDKDGKIQKPKDFVKPEDRIQKEVVEKYNLERGLNEQK